MKPEIKIASLKWRNSLLADAAANSTTSTQAEVLRDAIRRNQIRITEIAALFGLITDSIPALPSDQLHVTP